MQDTAFGLVAVHMYRSDSTRNFIAGMTAHIESATHCFVRTKCQAHVDGASMKNVFLPVHLCENSARSIAPPVLCDCCCKEDLYRQAIRSSSSISFDSCREADAAGSKMLGRSERTLSSCENKVTVCSDATPCTRKCRSKTPCQQEGESSKTQTRLPRASPPVHIINKTTPGTDSLRNVPPSAASSDSSPELIKEQRLKIDGLTPGVPCD